MSGVALILSFITQEYLWVYFKIIHTSTLIATISLYDTYIYFFG